MGEGYRCYRPQDSDYRVSDAEDQYTLQRTGRRLFRPPQSRTRHQKAHSATRSARPSGPTFFPRAVKCVNPADSAYTGGLFSKDRLCCEHLCGNSLGRDNNFDPVVTVSIRGTEPHYDTARSAVFRKRGMKHEEDDFTFSARLRSEEHTSELQ